MNPLVIFIILPVAFFGWILWVNLRGGEYRMKTRGVGPGYNHVHITRSEKPGVFWTLVAFHIALIAYITSIAFALE